MEILEINIGKLAAIYFGERYDTKNEAGMDAARNNFKRLLKNTAKLDLEKLKAAVDAYEKATQKGIEEFREKYNIK